jgi:hypothetical protein
MAIDEAGEYSGGPNIIQKAQDGHVDLTAREKREINAIYRHRMAGIDVSIPPTDLHRPAVDAVLAKFDNSKDTGITAGRTPDEAVGEVVT